MEIRTLRTFLMVADVGTIVEASRRLNCVQSNVTSRIKALEEELGVTLFTRSRSGMSLTSAGAVLRDHARTVLRAERDASIALSSHTSGGGLLRIGSMESTFATRLPACIGRFCGQNPTARIDLQSGPTEELVSLTLNGRIDVALIGGAYAHPDLRAVPVFNEEMVLISAQNAQRIEDAIQARLIVFRPGCSYRFYAETWVKRQGLGPNEIVELGTLDGILGCVASGVGVSILPKSVVQASVHRNMLYMHELDGADRFIDTYAIHRRSSGTAGLIEEFLSALHTPQAPALAS